ncbi:hypothetical protein PSACC_00439 [Paramicrosporidium saccamoebae]|uniref:Autophagy-related protein 26 n=1 Tax=Paramicrosporidium saccamoebae TaxID=1246581 RepID=A0A2H9TQ00_9FUNG|nr:hypothetical protein PSACC_00439 [Paramicrosporidium saccamoebae]
MVPTIFKLVSNQKPAEMDTSGRVINAPVELDLGIAMLSSKARAPVSNMLLVEKPIKALITVELAESLGKLAPNIHKMTELDIFDKEKTPTCLATMIEFVEATFVLHERLSVQDDLRHIREQQRTYEKSRERYETLAIRYSSLPKLKEYSLIREDTFQLYEGRRQYFQQLFSYVMRINKFKTGADIFFVEKCLSTASELGDFIQAMWSMMEAMNKPAMTMRTRLGAWQKECKSAMLKLDQKSAGALEQVRLKYSPEAPLDPTKGVEKEGYLCRKRQKSLGLSWRRVFVAIKGGIFIQYLTGHRRGTIEKSFEMHVLLCELRPADADRRHCFEVHTSMKTYVYQAESEEDMRDWIRVIENAKNHALRSSNAGDLVAPSNTSFVDEEAEMTDEGSTSVSQVATPKRISETSQDFERFSHIPYPPSETMFVSFSCLWEETSGEEKIVRGFGKLYGTERALYFGSNLFGVKQEFVHPWDEIHTVNYAMNEATGMLSMNNGAIRARTFLNERERTETLTMVWKNAKGEAPKTAAELKAALQSSLDNPGSRQLEASGITCGCTDHLERNEIDIDVPLGVDELFQLLMGDDSPVWKAVQQLQGYKNVKMQPWSLGSDGKEERTVSYLVPVNHPLVKAKETECLGGHTLLRRDPGKCYVVKQTATTPGVPYGDSFVMVSRYCMTHHSDGHARLRTFVGLNWVKSPLVKSMIRSSTLKGLAEYMTVYRKALWAEIRKANPEAPEEVEDVALNRTEEKKPEPTWWREHLELLCEFQRDVRERWRYNLDKAHISVPAFLLFIATMFFFLISVWLQFRSWRGIATQVPVTSLWEYEPPQKSLLVNLKESDWTSRAHFQLFQELSTSHTNFRILRQDLQAVLDNINNAECRIFLAQSITWLADRLTTCYADLSKNSKDCSDYELAWNEALKQTCK